MLHFNKDNVVGKPKIGMKNSSVHNATFGKIPKSGIVGNVLPPGVKPIPVVHGPELDKLKGFVGADTILQIGTCSGVVVKSDDTGVYIRSASHCAGVNNWKKSIKISSGDGKTHAEFFAGEGEYEIGLPGKDGENGDQALIFIPRSAMGDQKKDPKTYSEYQRRKLLPNRSDFGIRSCREDEIGDALSKANAGVYAVGSSDNHGYDSRENRVAYGVLTGKFDPSQWNVSNKEETNFHDMLSVQFPEIKWSEGEPPMKQALCRGDSGGPLIYAPNPLSPCVLGNTTAVELNVNDSCGKKGLFSNWPGEIYDFGFQKLFKRFCEKKKKMKKKPLPPECDESQAGKKKRRGRQKTKAAVQ